MRTARLLTLAGLLSVACLGSGGETRTVVVTVIKDEKTGEEKTEEVAEFFFIGARNRVAMPTKGRLFLGINELVVGDNVGEFTVLIEAGLSSDHPYL